MYRFIFSIVVFSFLFCTGDLAQECRADTAPITKTNISSDEMENYSIEDKIKEMQLAMKRSEDLKEKSELEKKLRKTEKEISALYELYKNKPEEFLKKEKYLNTLERMYAKTKKKIERLENEIK